MKRITAITAATMLALGLMAGPAAAEASDNASCMGQERSVQKGPFDKELARAFAQALGQNEKSNGVGALAKVVAQDDSLC